MSFKRFCQIQHLINAGHISEKDGKDLLSEMFNAQAQAPGVPTQAQASTLPEGAGTPQQIALTPAPALEIEENGLYVSKSGKLWRVLSSRTNSWDGEPRILFKEEGGTREHEYTPQEFQAQVARKYGALNWGAEDPMEVYQTKYSTEW